MEIIWPISGSSAFNPLTARLHSQNRARTSARVCGRRALRGSCIEPVELKSSRSVRCIGQSIYIPVPELLTRLGNGEVKAKITQNIPSLLSLYILYSIVNHSGQQLKPDAMNRRGHLSHKVPNVKLRPAPAMGVTTSRSKDKQKEVVINAMDEEVLRRAWDAAEGEDVLMHGVAEILMAHIDEEASTSALRSTKKPWENVVLTFTGVENKVRAPEDYPGKR